jgi:hypothetical protein
MDTYQGCQNSDFCAASNSSFIAPSPEEGDCEEHKLMKFLQPGPQHFSSANAISQNFFTSKYMSKGLGKALLVSQSQYQLMNIASQMKHNEVSLQLEIAELSCNLSTNQRRKLASILSACEEFFMKQREHESQLSASWPTSIPRSLKEICSFYMEDSWAIIPNLPCPTVRTVGVHAYVSLNDCVVDLLGHGIPIGLIEDDSTSQMVRTISESIRAKSIARRGQIMAGLGGDSSLCLYVV